MRHVVTTPRRPPYREVLAALGLLLLAFLVAHAAGAGMDAWQAARQSNEPVITAALSEQDLHNLIAMQRQRPDSETAGAEIAAGLETDTGLRHLLLTYPELLTGPTPAASTLADANLPATRAKSI